MSFKIDKSKTALVVIDLQKGIVARDTKPHPSSLVVENAKKIADQFRKLEMQVFLVHVTFSPDGKDRLNPMIDNQQPMSTPSSDWADFIPGVLFMEPTLNYNYEDEASIPLFCWVSQQILVLKAQLVLPMKWALILFLLKMLQHHSQ